MRPYIFHTIEQILSALSKSYFELPNSYQDINILRYRTNLIRFVNNYIPHLHIYPYITRQRILIMAGSNIEYVEVKLSDKEMDSVIPKWVEGFDNIEQIIQEVAVTDHKIQVGFYPDQEAFMCAIVPPFRNHANSGKRITSFSDDITECIAFSAYKHLVMSDPKEWASSSSKSRRG